MQDSFLTRRERNEDVAVAEAQKNDRVITLELPHQAE